MHDEYVYLWSQWGVLNTKLHHLVKEVFGDLKTAWKQVNSQQTLYRNPIMPAGHTRYDLSPR